MKKIIFSLLLVSLITILPGCTTNDVDNQNVNTNTSATEINNTSITTSENIIVGSETEEETTVFDENISDKTLVEDIHKALKSINVNPKDVEYVAKIQNWASGERYKYNYNSETFVIYTNLNSTVFSINTESGERLYEQSKNAYTDSENKKNTISLIYGQLGEYGKTVKVNENEYIHFYVPAGTYTAECDLRMCTLYVAKNTLSKDDAGYDSYEIVETFVFNEKTKEATVTIEENEHIELTINGAISLTLQ